MLVLFWRGYRVILTVNIIMNTPDPYTNQTTGDPYSYLVDPTPEPLTPLEWWVFTVIFYILYLEIKYMWSWCRWFTNC